MRAALSCTEPLGLPRAARQRLGPDGRPSLARLALSTQAKRDV